MFSNVFYRATVYKTGDATPWARASNNVKKPKSQTCASFRFKIFVKQNRIIFGLSHTFDSEGCYCTK